MWTANIFALFAINATLVIAGHNVTAGSSDVVPNEASELVPAAALVVPPATGATQQDETRLLEYDDIATTEASEERMPGSPVAVLEKAVGAIQSSASKISEELKTQSGRLANVGKRKFDTYKSTEEFGETKGKSGPLLRGNSSQKKKRTPTEVVPADEGPSSAKIQDVDGHIDPTHNDGVVANNGDKELKTQSGQLANIGTKRVDTYKSTEKFDKTKGKSGHLLRGSSSQKKKRAPTEVVPADEGPSSAKIQDVDGHVDPTHNDGVLANKNGKELKTQRGQLANVVKRKFDTYKSTEEFDKTKGKSGHLLRGSSSRKKKRAPTEVVPADEGPSSTKVQPIHGSAFQRGIKKIVALAVKGLSREDVRAVASKETDLKTITVKKLTYTVFAQLAEEMQKKVDRWLAEGLLRDQILSKLVAEKGRRLTDEEIKRLNDCFNPLSRHKLGEEIEPLVMRGLSNEEIRAHLKLKFGEPGKDLAKRIRESIKYYTNEQQQEREAQAKIEMLLGQDLSEDKIFLSYQKLMGRDLTKKDKRLIRKFINPLSSLEKENEVDDLLRSKATHNDILERLKPPHRALAKVEINYIDRFIDSWKPMLMKEEIVDLIWSDLTQTGIVEQLQLTNAEFVSAKAEDVEGTIKLLFQRYDIIMNEVVVLFRRGLSESDILEGIRVNRALSPKDDEHISTYVHQLVKTFKKTMDEKLMIWSAQDKGTGDVVELLPDPQPNRNKGLISRLFDKLNTLLDDKEESIHLLLKIWLRDEYHPIKAAMQMGIPESTFMKPFYLEYCNLYSKLHS